MQFLEKLWKMWKNRNIKLVITERRTIRLVSEPNYNTKKFFKENLLAIETRKTQIFMNKPVYLGLSILYQSKAAIYEFWYDYVKPKYCENAKLYMDTETFTVHVKTDDDISGFELVYHILQFSIKKYLKSTCDLEKT